MSFPQKSTDIFIFLHKLGYMDLLGCIKCLKKFGVFETKFDLCVLCNTWKNVWLERLLEWVT